MYVTMSCILYGNVILDMFSDYYEAKMGFANTFKHWYPYKVQKFLDLENRNKGMQFLFSTNIPLNTLPFGVLRNRKS